MGRRSQKSGAGQAKNRAKREVGVAESAGDDSADKKSEDGIADTEDGDDSAGKLAVAGSTDTENTDVTANDSPEAVDAVNNAVDDTVQDAATNDALDGESADDIAAGYASIEANESPQTCCPDCKTVFEVSPELLSSTDTRVRCGECLGIFDALANLRDPDDNEGGKFHSDSTRDGSDNEDKDLDGGNHDDASAESDSDDESANDSAANVLSLDVTYADFSLFSADAALPEVEYLDETREVQPFDFDDPGGDDELDETYSETLFAHGPEVDARSAIHETDNGSAGIDESKTSGTTDDGELAATEKATAGVAAASRDATQSETFTGDGLDDLVDSLRRSESGITVEERSVGSWWFRGSLSFLALSLAAGLYGYREREALQHSRYLRPALESFCTAIGCTLAERVDLASLQVLNRSVFSHPKLNNVLVINIGFVNKASFNQRFPVLEIRLTDRNGVLVVKNSFEPSDYLDNWQPGDLLDAGKRLNISLNVRDPGNQAISFELDFR